MIMVYYREKVPIEVSQGQKGMGRARGSSAEPCPLLPGDLRAALLPPSHDGCLTTLTDYCHAKLGAQSSYWDSLTHCL